ncbi:hypothetical protein [Moraxella sp. ZY200743]|uniref:hypothetical protein n=1 Tax=Moraxella sp. ZY200743 TaxID=2911970 RepID=UPI003D7D1701
MVEKFQSNFVFGLQGNLYQDFLNSVAHPIIQNIIGTAVYEVVDFDKHLSLLDFDKSKRKESIFPEFYLNFLGDIIKESNSVSFKKKVCITLDERLCRDICPNTGRKITTIKIGGVDLAYFIYFDITEFFDFVYGNEIQKHHSQKDENIKPENDSKSNNELLDDKVENIEKFDDSKSTKLVLDESIITKLFSGNKNNESNLNIANYDYIEKIGYIHNINNERGLSFIHETKDGDIGFPIYYQDFPEVEKFPIGTPIKAFGYLHNDKFYVDNYEVVDIDELPFQLMRLSGTLKIVENSFAIIRTSIGGVYTSLDLIQEYTPKHQVECVAIEAYNHKRQENGWKAIWVGNSL